MTTKKPRYSPRDQYLVIDIETNTIYEKFAHKTSAERFLIGHPLRDILKVELNPKYVITKKR